MSAGPLMQQSDAISKSELACLLSLDVGVSRKKRILMYVWYPRCLLSHLARSSNQTEIFTHGCRRDTIIQQIQRTGVVDNRIVASKEAAAFILFFCNHPTSCGMNPTSAKSLLIGRIVPLAVGARRRTDAFDRT
jgi:hypothetical protein